MSRRPVWIGADPGGTSNFGIAELFADGATRTGCVSSAHEAAEWIQGTPQGAGIDAPMWLSSAKRGDRKADRWLRCKYGNASPGKVLAINSLYGAVLAQGAMFAVELRCCFPELSITESHPGLFLRAWGCRFDEPKRFDELKRCFGIHAKPGISDHERDAVIAALAAREGFSGCWRRDLALKRLPEEQDPATYWLAPMHYWWFE
ncbi:MAG: hypothetical protein OXG79_05840 [Chloroflexi bacterium]|nr:hypothetical protein [Chloroflexota bacterium]